MEALRAQLMPKLHALARVNRLALVQPLIQTPRFRRVEAEIQEPPAVVAIGVSTGGPEALERILPVLPRSFPLPVLIVQHMPELFTRLLAERLDKSCELRVREAAEGMAIAPGNIFIARGDWHLEALAPAYSGQAPTLHLTRGPMENHCRPSVDALFRSLAGVYGAGVLGVVLTGMGYDGLAGCRVLRRVGATILAQDEASSVVWGMPGAVVSAGLAHRVLPLCEMASEVMAMACRPCSETVMLRKAVS
jgi:two-component system chemotaxis response regulator CheB